MNIGWNSFLYPRSTI